ncbi:MAG: TIGR01777 family protein [Alphaproteobacteria bacterium]|nr:TIGR01777 family protein [Alphaproteobacteria bacterium]MCB9794461.1 TIGR01777 family protein [Alphaproteobacteria bacterium]
MAVFEKRCVMPVSPEALYDWHAREGAFDRLVPPWEEVHIESKQGGITDGSRLVMRNRLGPFSMRWVADHEAHVAGEQFRDVQTQGPFARWAHTHRFEPVEGEPDKSVLVDHIEYELPMGPAGDLVAGRAVRQRIESMFAWRHQRTRWDLERHAAYADRPRLDVAVTGASGLIGTALCAFLSTGGHRVRRLVRRAPRDPDEVRWDIRAGHVDLAALEGVDAVVHLAGENVGGGRWTADRKARILDSRVKGTRLIAQAMTRLEKTPSVLVSASAVGIYGHTADRLADEDAPHGSDFLAEVCEAWEAAAAPAKEAGIRVAHPRIGVVMAVEGGALEKMLPPFRMGVGGPVGSGEQYMPWVSLDDAVDALHLLLMEDVRGPVNVVGPNPHTSAEFARTLGAALHRPAVLPLPAMAVKAMFGEMGECVLLSGQRADNRRLRELGFRYRYNSLAETLRSELGQLSAPDDAREEPT